MRPNFLLITAAVFAATGMLALVQTPAAGQETQVLPPLTPAEINDADLGQLLLPAPVDLAEAEPLPARPDPALVRLQVLLDRAGASPGVIDGFAGDNVRKAIVAFEAMRGLPTDGELDEDVIAALGDEAPVIGHYRITADDLAGVTGPTPSDYADKARQSFLGYETAAEAIAERFHMDIDLLHDLNPEATYAEGETVYVAAYGPGLQGTVALIDVDKQLRQVRAYDAEGRLLAAYPATIGSPDNPSPTGVHLVAAVAPMPNYTYNPKVNFQQGNNTGVLTIPPGPNGPVGSMWIDLTEPTFGIHGTPDPSLIDKTGSHGCVRLTNWDANELAGMVSAGVEVRFLD